MVLVGTATRRRCSQTEGQGAGGCPRRRAGSGIGRWVRAWIPRGVPSRSHTGWTVGRRRRSYSAPALGGAVGERVGLLGDVLDVLDVEGLVLQVEDLSHAVAE